MFGWLRRKAEGPAFLAGRVRELELEARRLEDELVEARVTANHNLTAVLLSVGGEALVERQHLELAFEQSFGVRFERHEDGSVSARVELLS